MSKVFKPWTPLRVTEENGRITTEIYGRRNVHGALSPLESMRSNGIELLSAPIRFVGREDGREFTFSTFSPYLMEDGDEGESTVVLAAESDEFILDIVMKTEFDGFIDTTMTIAPRGRSVAEIFGLEAAKKAEYRLDKLWIEIPLRSECAKYFQYYPRPAGDSALSGGGEMRTLSTTFKEQMLVTNDDVGFLICFESEEKFAPQSNERAFELIHGEREVLLRIRIFDEEPREWKIIEGNRTRMPHISIRFGIMTTPVKPIEEDMLSEKAVHIDCFKKIKEDYEDFLSTPFEDTDEIVFDRLVRLGVNTLYLHEKWNDLQNSPILTRKTASRLRFIIDECHKRGIKVIPYFGYEMATLAPYYRELAPRVRVDGDFSGWYRYPAQRDARVCQGSEWSDFFTSGVERLMDRFGFDGVYLDGTPYVRACSNERHGCGYTTLDGERRQTYPVFAIRETMRKLYEIVRERRGGVINCHAGSAFNMPALSFATSLWDGEIFQKELLSGELETLPDEYFKCLYTGKNLGLLIYMLCYLNPPSWSFEMALATALPFGILPKVNDVGYPLEVISKIWSAYESFGTASAEFIPFYSEKEQSVTASDKKIKVSAYERDGKSLVILAVTDKAVCSDFTLSTGGRRVRDALSDTVISDGELLHLCGFDFKLLLVE